eukprot:gnl/TRDRNA2_/TRDRNA2_164773_c0_seq3.p1 gnl/TRDRNA2_/TRDRNA2_164773_c0~~gnl/TRDRNA2_/TRDRNA2_164773_c0_seq3.p1  ORF type:complete len:449 (-),score=132.23 gnl/TRDRNA2_/TRDRNA2_164773_c0_seq3:102-1292(-)
MGADTGPLCASVKGKFEGHFCACGLDKGEKGVSAGLAFAGTKFDGQHMCGPQACFEAFQYESRKKALEHHLHFEPDIIDVQATRQKCQLCSENEDAEDCGASKLGLKSKTEQEDDDGPELECVDEVWIAGEDSSDEEDWLEDLDEDLDEFESLKDKTKVPSEQDLDEDLDEFESLKDKTKVPSEQDMALEEKPDEVTPTLQSEDDYSQEAPDKEKPEIEHDLSQDDEAPQDKPAEETPASPTPEIEEDYSQDEAPEETLETPKPEIEEDYSQDEADEASETSKPDIKEDYSQDEAPDETSEMPKPEIKIHLQDEAEEENKGLSKIQSLQAKLQHKGGIPIGFMRPPKGLLKHTMPAPETAAPLAETSTATLLVNPAFKRGKQVGKRPPTRRPTPRV